MPEQNPCPHGFPWRGNALSLVGGLLLLLAAAAAADTPQRWYDIEVIIFAHQGVPDTETWPLDPGHPNTRTGMPLLKRSASSDAQTNPTAGLLEHTPFQKIPVDEYRLTRTSQRLFESEHYRLLSHVAWRQPGLDRDLALPIHLQGGLHWLERGEDGEAVARVEPNLPAGAEWTEAMTWLNREDEPELLPRDVHGPLPPVIDGTLRLIQTRYLHAEVDLLYRDPQPDPRLRAYHRPGVVFQQADQGGRIPSRFRLTDSRRMRSGEIHYIDHPRLGIIVFVNRYELADIEVDDELDNAEAVDAEPLSSPTPRGTISR